MNLSGWGIYWIRSYQIALHKSCRGILLANWQDIFQGFSYDRYYLAKLELMKNLDSLTIHQFRGLRDVELKDLGQINLFVGINNSGKTTVLEALSIYCRPRYIRNWLTIALQREQKTRLNLTQSLDAVLWMFPHSSIPEHEELQKYTIAVSSTGSFSVKKMIATCKEIEVISLNERNEQEFENDDNPLIKQGIDLKIELFDTPIDSSDLSHQNPNSIDNFQLIRGGRYNLSKKDGPNLNTSVVTPSSHRSEVGQFQLLSEATFRNFKFDVVKLLQQMDSNISDIVILLSPGSADLDSIFIFNIRNWDLRQSVLLVTEFAGYFI